MNYLRISDKNGFLLIVISSALLGIWAVRDTIALRNILLAIGVIFSIIYWTDYFWNYRNNPNFFKLSEIQSISLIPVILILAMFSWVILHYLFFTQFPKQQWHELSSTWLRAFLSSIIAITCAFILRRNHSIAWLLWFGLLISFLVLLCQYIPKAIVNQSLFATDFFGNYIYRAKFNGVLAGLILFAAVMGLFIDNLPNLFAKTNIPNAGICQFRKIAFILFTLTGLFFPLFANVFIFDAKNGIGAAAILLLFWLAVGGLYLIKQLFINTSRQYFGWIRLIGIYLVLLVLFSWLAFKHTKNNPGWESLIEDISISAQIDKNLRWKTPSEHGLPHRLDGSEVAENTYERVAWAVVGLQLIADYPLGNGLQRALPSQMSQGGIDFNRAAYTHSGWIDLGLSYGLPGLLLMPTLLIFCLIRCIMKGIKFYRATVASLAISMLFIYLVGEYAFQHGIEILMFISSLLVGLILPENQESNS
jgi:hypothetical protein